MGGVTAIPPPEGMEGISDAEVEIGNKARDAFEQIILGIAQATVKLVAARDGTRQSAKIGIIYNSMVAMNGAHRYMASILGWHGQKDQTDELALNINEGSMMLAAMMMATMSREVGEATQISYDIQLLAKSVERAERALGRSLDGQIDPDILHAVRNMDTILAALGLSVEAMEANREKAKSRNLQ